MAPEVTTLWRVDTMARQPGSACQRQKPGSVLLPLLAAASCLVIAGPVAQSAVAATPSITLSTGLTPAFSTGVSDYWTTCPSGTVVFTVGSASGATVAVGAAKARSGRLTSTQPLRAGRALKWTVSIRSSGRTRSTSHWVRCVPADMPVPKSVVRAGPTEASFYLVNPGLPSAVIGKTSYTQLLDRNGVPVWWRTSGLGPLNPTIISKRRIAVWSPLTLNPLGDFGAGRWAIVDFAGNVLSRLVAPGIGTDPHELVETPDGSFLTVTYRPVSPMSFASIGGVAAGVGYRGELRELAADGSVLWSWRAEDHISLDELAPWVKALIRRNERNVLVGGLPAFDVDHISSIEPYQGGYLVSARHLDAVYLVDRITGDIAWKLGGTRTPRSLDVLSDDVITPLGAPHDARAFADGTISVVDDGLGLGRTPRVVTYRIDPIARTATVLQKIRRPGLKNSNCCGSARRLAGGNWVIGWGSNPVFTETGPFGQPLLTVTLPDGMPSYRVQPVTDPTITAAFLRSAMDRSPAARQ